MRHESSYVFGNMVSAPALRASGPSSSAVTGDRPEPGDTPRGESDPQDDLKLMARVARGDRDAQRQVARRLFRRVEGLCRAVLRDSEQALDARQLSILEILRSAHSFRGTSTLERWADRITARTALRALARERRAHRAPLDVQRTTTNPASESDLLAREYLDELSERQRLVVVMRHGLEYSIEEIAEVTGISKNSVKDRLLRARGIMRRAWLREQQRVEVSTSGVAG
jgi:RNA polymerase sigma factor (sigma-70 family)